MGFGIRQCTLKLCKLSGPVQKPSLELSGLFFVNLYLHYFNRNTILKPSNVYMLTIRNDNNLDPSEIMGESPHFY